MRRKLLFFSVVPLALALAGFGSVRLYRAAKAPEAVSIPTAAVKRGDVLFTITAKGELSGGNSEVLAAPMIGGGALTITFMRDSGEVVKESDVVVQFDTTDQEFRLKEAEADLTEAEQYVSQAQADSQAAEEEARYALVQARADLKLAELEARRNPIISRIDARENELTLIDARNRVAQLEKDLPARLATTKASVDIQQTAASRARMSADRARHNIESMTLRAKRSGYIAIQPNSDTGFRRGAYLPALQVGDTVRSGMAIAQIPDLRNWEVLVRVSELDRGHLNEEQKVAIEIVALPDRTFNGHLKAIGSASGSSWNRYAECRIALDDPSPDLRPGMSVRALITTETMRNVLWVRSQALFESDGRKFVYVKSGGSFTPADVKLVRRSESQAVIEGLQEGQLVALASPEQMKKQPSRAEGALQAIPK